MKDTLKARNGYKVQIISEGGIVILKDGPMIVEVYEMKSKKEYKSNMRENSAFKALNVFTTIHANQFVEWHDGRKTNLTMVS